MTGCVSSMANPPRPGGGVSKEEAGEHLAYHFFTFLWNLGYNNHEIARVGEALVRVAYNVKPSQALNPPSRADRDRLVLDTLARPALPPLPPKED